MADANQNSSDGSDCTSLMEEAFDETHRHSPLSPSLPGAALSVAMKGVYGSVADLLSWCSCNFYSSSRADAAAASEKEKHRMLQLSLRDCC